MALLIFALLHYITVASSIPAFSFHGATGYGDVHLDQPVEQHSFHSTIKPISLEEDIKINVPHPINDNTISTDKDIVVKEIQERTLHILKADADPIKLSGPQQTAYIHESTSDREVVPVRKILHEAVAIDVNEEDRKVPDQKVVFRNTLTHVEAIPTDIVTEIIATTAASMPTTSPVATNTSTSTQDKKSTSELTEQNIVQIQTKEKSLEGGQEMWVNNEEPSAKEFAVNNDETKLTIASIDDLSKSSVLAPAIAEETLADQHHKLSQQRSNEDDDSDTFVDLDDRSEVDVEFQDSERTIPAGVHLTSTTSTTSTYKNVARTESSVIDEELLNLIMLFITLLPDIDDEPSIWSRIVAGLQCALRDCRIAFPRLTTVATPVGNGTFTIRRARSECLCYTA